MFIRLRRKVRVGKYGDSIIEVDKIKFFFKVFSIVV